MLFLFRILLIRIIGLQLVSQVCTGTKHKPFPTRLHLSDILVFCSYICTGRFLQCCEAEQVVFGSGHSKSLWMQLAAPAIIVNQSQKLYLGL